MAEIEKLTDQIDRLLAEHRYEDGGAWYDGREETLLEVRRLAKAHAKMQSAQADNIAEVTARLVKENTALQKQIDAARFELSRGVSGLIMARPEQTLAEIAAEVVKEFQRTAIVGEEHVCECDCETAADLEDIREGIKIIRSDLEGLL